MNKSREFNFIAEIEREIIKGLEYSHDLILIIAFTALTDLFIITPALSETIFRAALGIPLVLFYPGYALIAALFPKKGDLDSIERIALSFGLSIAVVPLIGLGLNYTPWGIIKPLLQTINTFILAMCILAHWRRLKLPAEERYRAIHISINIEKIARQIYEPQKTEGRSRKEAILTFILVLSILASVAMLIYVIVTPKIGEKFTEFYILGKNGKAADYPTELKTGDGGTVIVGVVNHEYQLTTYVLEVRLAGGLLINDRIVLEHNTTYEKPYQITPDKNGTNMKLEFLLLKDGNSTPYRNLHLWVNVSG